MFEPVSFVATGPSVRRAATTHAVVVVLPLVPLTRVTSRDDARSDRSVGATRNPTRPPMTVPWPRPARRDTSFTIRIAPSASHARAPSSGTRGDLAGGVTVEVRRGAARPWVRRRD